MKIEKLVKLVSEIPHISMYGYYPPYNVLQSFLNSDMKTMGFDESHKWKAFDLTKKDYEIFEKSTGLKPLKCPDKVSDIYSYHAWVNFVESNIPFDDHLKHILKEKDALISLNEALELGDNELISQKHIDYIETADNAMNFLNEYLNN